MRFLLESSWMRFGPAGRDSLDWSTAPSALPSTDRQAMGQSPGEGVLGSVPMASVAIGTGSVLLLLGLLGLALCRRRRPPLGSDGKLELANVIALEDLRDLRDPERNGALLSSLRRAVSNGGEDQEEEGDREDGGVADGDGVFLMVYLPSPYQHTLTRIARAASTSSSRDGDPPSPTSPGPGGVPPGAPLGGPSGARRGTLPGALLEVLQENQPEAKPETQLETRPRARRGTLPETQLEVGEPGDQLEAKPEAQLEVRGPEARLEVGEPGVGGLGAGRPEIQLETPPRARPKAKPETQLEAKLETRPRAQRGTLPETQLEVGEPGDQLEAKPETQLETPPRARRGTQLEAQLETQLKARPEPRLEVGEPGDGALRAGRLEAPPGAQLEVGKPEDGGMGASGPECKGLEARGPRARLGAVGLDEGEPSGALGGEVEEQIED